jgi:hypothetical protein
MQFVTGMLLSAVLLNLIPGYRLLAQSGTATKGETLHAPDQMVVPAISAASTPIEIARSALAALGGAK